MEDKKVKGCKFVGNEDNCPEAKKIKKQIKKIRRKNVELRKQIKEKREFFDRFPKSETTREKMPCKSHDPFWPSCTACQYTEHMMEMGAKMMFHPFMGE